MFRSARKYIVGFQLAFSRALIYRANLFLGAITTLIWFGTLILLYRAIGGSVGTYSTSELVTYILATSFLAALLFTTIPEQIANEIVEGDLTNYLLRPINYIFYWISRAVAVRSVLCIIAIIEIFILSRFFLEDILFPESLAAYFQTALLAVGSLFLMTLFDFIAAFFSFWTNRGFGARWLLMICARFLSGAALPVSLMPTWAQTLFHATPFPSLISAPAEAYLGRLGGTLFVQALLVQWFWITFFALALFMIWRAGIKSYAAYGS